MDFSDEVNINAEWVSNRLNYYWLSGIWQQIKKEASEQHKPHTFRKIGEFLEDKVALSAIRTKEDTQDLVIQFVMKMERFQGNIPYHSKIAELCLFYIYSDYEHIEKGKTFIFFKYYDSCIC